MQNLSFVLRLYKEIIKTKKSPAGRDYFKRQKKRKCKEAFKAAKIKNDTAKIIKK